MNAYQKRKYEWVMAAKTSSMIRKIYRKFNDVRWYTNLTKARNRAARKIQTAYRFFRSRRGITEASRVIQEIK